MIYLAQTRKTIIKRALLLMICISFFFMIFAGRVVYVQVAKEVKGQDLQAMAASRWTTTQTLHGERGTIFDRKGEELAEEVQSYTAFAVLDENYEDHVKDPEETAEKLAPLIEMEVNDLKDLLTREEVFQVELGSGSKYLTLSEKQEIEELELPGIHFRTEEQRYYPNQTFASHVLGYTERDMSEARMGLEKGLNEQLSPTDGSLSYQRNVKGIPLLDKQEVLKEPVDGEDVYLTIDSNIQTALEQAMTEVEEEYEPNKMTAIIASAETGEILGMSNRPSFNPNEYESITNYTNYAISDRIEPGSTMKMFTLAAAMEEGVYNGDETYESGTYDIGSTTIGDHNNSEGWGEITYDEGLERSSNVAFAKIALEKLKPERLYNYLGAFGFREPTGIDLPNEANSSIAESSKLDAAITAFGQATAVTPIQLVQAATAIANDGKMMSPYIVDKIYDSTNEEYTYEAEPESAGNPISEKTAAEVRKKLENVVTSENGTGRPFYIDGIDVAGKTGTAQISNPDGGGYISGQNQNIFSFIGMAPADDPSIIVYVAVDRPKLEGNESGSAPVAQIFNSVMKQSLSYMNLTPKDEVEDEEVYEEEGIEAESYVDQSVKEAVNNLEELGLEPQVLGDGNMVVEQYPAEGEQLIIGEKVFLLTDGEVTMPDLAGWSLRDAKRMSDLLGINLHHVGSGYVTDQSVEPGTPVQKDGYVTIELKTPSQIKEETEQQENAEEVPEEEQTEEEIERRD
ncbi:penicillin-binding protein [Alteribacillus sp. JSM 102045]|uniref:penicillin-binding protein n=1 Tax=Alteribacillus sp. JSM 102045 TaxID=1562101 RepID=UPI0035C18476